jgi:predicted DNA-binding ribbon-helix-helix protein
MTFQMHRGFRSVAGSAGVPRVGISAFNGKAVALTEDEMRRAAPSIFAETAHDSRSDRFRPIPTIEVIRALQREGFSPVGVMQSTTRDPGKVPFTKHLVRFRRLDISTTTKALSVGDTTFECLLKNANDGSAAYDLLASLFRLACLNGMVTKIGDMDSVKVRHSGDVASKVIEGTYRVLDTAETVLRAPQDWSQIELNRDERMALAESSHMVRFADAEGNVNTPIQPAQLLIPRRPADNAHNLWTTFNVIQESVIKGGLSGMGRDIHNRPRRSTTRTVNGIDQGVRLNQALWTLAEKMAELKAAA